MDRKMLLAFGDGQMSVGSVCEIFMRKIHLLQKTVEHLGVQHKLFLPIISNIFIFINFNCVNLVSTVIFLY